MKRAQGSATAGSGRVGELAAHPSAESANNALTASAAPSGSAANITAAQLTFAGRTYLAINQAAPGFQDATDVLLDITGATGTIDAADFIT